MNLIPSKEGLNLAIFQESNDRILEKWEQRKSYFDRKKLMKKLCFSSFYANQYLETQLHNLVFFTCTMNLVIKDMTEGLNLLNQIIKKNQWISLTSKTTKMSKSGLSQIGKCKIIS